MPYPIDAELAQTVIAWISQTAHAENVTVISEPGQINQDGDWLYVPLSVDGEDAYDRASRLQQIEEHWDSADHDGLHLLLVPFKPRMATQDDGYTQLNELLQRQRRLIDQPDIPLDLWRLAARQRRRLRGQDWRARHPGGARTREIQILRALGKRLVGVERRPHLAEFPGKAVRLPEFHVQPVCQNQRDVRILIDGDAAGALQRRARRLPSRKLPSRLINGFVDAADAIFERHPGLPA